MTRLIACSCFVFDAVATGLSMTGAGGQVTSAAWLLAGMLTVMPFIYYVLTIMLAALQAPQVLALDDLQQPALSRSA